MIKSHKAIKSDLQDSRYCFRTIERNHWLCASRWLLNIKCIVFDVYTKLTQPRIEWIPNLVNAIFHAVCLVWSKFTWNPAKTFQWKCVKGYIIGFLPIYNGWSIGNEYTRTVLYRSFDKIAIENKFSNQIFLTFQFLFHWRVSRNQDVK